MNEPACDPGSEPAASVNFDATDLLFLTVCLLLFVCGCVGNATVFLVAVCSRSMRTMMNMFLTNLSVGNFFFIIFCLPFTTIEDLYQRWHAGPFMCKLVKFMQNVSVLGSIMWLTALSIERRLAFTTSFNQVRFSNAHTAKAISVALWIAACFLSIPMPIISEIQIRDMNNPRCGYTASAEKFATMYEYIFLFGLMVFLPVVVICVMHVKVAAILLKKSESFAKEHDNPLAARLNVTRNFTRSQNGSANGNLQAPHDSVMKLGSLSDIRLSVLPNMSESGLSCQSHMQHPRRVSDMRCIKKWKQTANTLIVLVLFFAVSYWPLCIITFVFNTTEIDDSQSQRTRSPENETTSSTFFLFSSESECTNKSHANANVNANVNVNANATSAAASLDDAWKPYFLFARAAFYLAPAINPFVFYLISRQLRRELRICIRKFRSFFICPRSSSNSFDYY